jgi:hypothetical protein
MIMINVEESTKCFMAYLAMSAISAGVDVMK